jgi:cytidine deaminase
MHLDQTLVDAAIELLERRFPGREGIAAAMYTQEREVLTSVYFEPEWGSAMLCAEAGAICEAEKLGKRVVASVCVSRLDGASPILVLTPCGICQERLFHWGQDVEVAVPQAGDATAWSIRTLREVQPYYWVNAFDRQQSQDDPSDAGDPRPHRSP